MPTAGWRENKKGIPKGVPFFAWNGRCLPFQLEGDARHLSTLEAGAGQLVFARHPLSLCLTQLRLLPSEEYKKMRRPSGVFIRIEL